MKRFINPIHSLLIAGIFLIVCTDAFAQVSLAERFKDIENVRVSVWNGEEIVHKEQKIHIKLRDVGRLEAVLGHSLMNVQVDRAFNKLGWGVLRLDAETDLFETIEQLKTHPDVLEAEPVYVGEVGILPNDPNFYRQWALNNTGQSPTNGTPGADISARYTWDITTGSSDVVVAVLDTGIPLQSGTTNLSHPELQNTNRIILGPNFSDTTQTVRDGQGHGTHVAGIVGAETNNSTGIGGTTWDSELLIVKTNDNSVFGVYTLSSFQNGVLYASDYADSTGKRVVINFSSGGGSGSQSYIDAINYAAARDVLIVAITHNDGASNGVRYPARYASSYSNVIAVGATDHNDSRASYSNAGPQITLTAPGGFGGSGAGDVRNIYSTMPNYAVALTQQAGYSQNYDYAPGTSMAAPHVSGAAALILSVNPDLTPAQVRSRLEDSADKVSGMSGQPFTNEYGYGRLNAYEAVKHALPVQLDGHFFAGNQTLNSTHIYNDIQGETSHEFGILTIPSDKVVVIDGTYTGFGSTWAKLYVNGRLVITEGTSMSQVALDIKNGGEVIIAKDANLSGVPVTIETGGAVEIRPGATLTNSEVIVENGGELLARGSSTDKITFNGKGIVFENGSGGEVSYAEIRNAATGIQLTGTGTNVQILDNLIENCTIGLKVYQSNALVAGNIIENNAYGINAEFVSSAAEYENNKVRYNSVRGLFLNASSMWITHSVFAGNGGNQVLINDGGPGFSESPGLEGYNVIAQGAGPMLRAQNGATVFMGYSIDGGYNSFYGTDLPHIYAQNHSGVYADRNYWDGGPGNHADGTSWVLDRYPLGSDPNPPYYQNILASRQSGASGSLPSISDTDTGSGPPVALIEALHLGMERNYEEALAELARFMEQQRHSEYAPLALFGYHALVQPHDRRGGIGHRTAVAAKQPDRIPANLA